MDLRDLVDVTYRLFAEWYTQDEFHMSQMDTIARHFRDLETQYETGELVLPGWASIGNAAAQYGKDDGADPFASPTDPEPPT